MVAAGGYRLNRTAGIRPSEILAAYPLKLNLDTWAPPWSSCARSSPGCCARTGRTRARARRATGGGAWRSRGAGAVLFALALLALVHGAGALAFSGPPRTAGARPDAPDVVIILVDALRADHLGAYGHARDTTPAIDSLASDGVLFRQAISQSTFTKSSIASLFTGRYPYQHGVYWGSRTADPELPGAVTSDVLPARERTLAEMLRRRGLFTAAWVHNTHLRRFMGFGQGFVLYRDQAGDAARITRLATDWFDGPGRRYRTFAYIHYIDVHDPYRPAPPYDTLFGPYDDPYAGVDLADWGEHLEAIREGRRPSPRSAGGDEAGLRRPDPLGRRPDRPAARDAPPHRPLRRQPDRRHRRPRRRLLGARLHLAQHHALRGAGAGAADRQAAPSSTIAATPAPR